MRLLTNKLVQGTIYVSLCNVQVCQSQYMRGYDFHSGLIDDDAFECIILTFWFRSSKAIAVNI